MPRVVTGVTVLRRSAIRPRIAPADGSNAARGYLPSALAGHADSQAASGRRLDFGGEQRDSCADATTRAGGRGGRTAQAALTAPGSALARSGG
jgi:hypothetical protein